MRSLLADLGYVQREPTVIFSDNKGVVDLQYDPVAFKKTKHILIAAEGLRDWVMRRVARIDYIPGSLNVADMLTKPLAVGPFGNLYAALQGMVNPVPV